MIPVIDLGSIGRNAADTKDEDLKSLGDNIRRAIQTAGVCYLSNHGIEQSVIDEYMTVSLEFFSQHEHIKRDLERKQGCLFGWAGYEKEIENPARPGGLKESFNFKPSEFTEEWPHAEKFRTLSLSMFQKISPLAFLICDALSLAVGLDKEFFRRKHALVGSDSNSTMIRPTYYPALSPKKEIKPGQIRCGEHTDYGTITLLYQDTAGGLEIKLPEKGYVPAPPVPGTFLIILGDLLQRWTADDLPAAEHRVIIPDDDSMKRKNRQSFGFFLRPDDDAVIKCSDGSDKYEPISTWRFLKSRAEHDY